MLLGGFSDNWKSRCHLSPKFNHLADAALIKRRIGYLSLKFMTSPNSMTSGKEKAHYLPMICLCEEDVMYSDRTHCISRRAFVGAAGGGVLSLLMKPDLSLASELSSTVEPASSAEEADRLWEQAVARAKREGSAVYCGVPALNEPIPYAHITGVTNQIRLTIKGVYTLVQGVAAYNAYSNGNIDKCYSANIQVSTGQTVQWCTPTWTITDSGKTLCVTYSCSIYWPRNILSAACHFYAEFWSDGSGYIKGGPVG